MKMKHHLHQTLLLQGFTTLTTIPTLMEHRTNFNCPKIDKYKKCNISETVNFSLKMSQIREHPTLIFEPKSIVASASKAPHYTPPQPPLAEGVVAVIAKQAVDQREQHVAVGIRFECVFVNLGAAMRQSNLQSGRFVTADEGMMKHTHMLVHGIAGTVQDLLDLAD